MSVSGSLHALLGPGAAAQLRAVAVQSLVSSCDAASDAYRACRHSDGFTYGTNRWRFGAAELVDRFDGRPGVVIVKVGSLRLAKVGQAASCLLYPVAVGSTARLDLHRLRIRPSKFRLSLFAPEPPAVQPELDLQYDNGPVQAATHASSAQADRWADDAAGGDAAGVAELEDEAVADHDLTQLRQEGRRVLLLSYTSNPTNGLLAAVVGEADMAEDGTVTYRWCEALDVPAGAGERLRLLVEAEQSGPDFTDGPEPTLEVAPHLPAHAPATSVTGGPARSSAGPDTDPVRDAD